MLSCHTLRFHPQTPDPAKSWTTTIIGISSDKDQELVFVIKIINFLMIYKANVIDFIVQLWLPMDSNQRKRIYRQFFNFNQDATSFFRHFLLVIVRK